MSLQMFTNFHIHFSGSPQNFSNFPNFLISRNTSSSSSSSSVSGSPSSPSGGSPSGLSSDSPEENPLQDLDEEENLLQDLCENLDEENENDKSSGGLLALVRKDSAIGWNQQFVPVVPGRIGFVHFSQFSQNLNAIRHFYSWGAHNHGISLQQFLAFEAVISKQIQLCKRFPETRFLSFNSDLNLRPPGTEPRRLDQPCPRMPGAHLHRKPPPRPLEKRWQCLLQTMVEVSTPTHTHINISSLSTSTIDGSFFAGPLADLKM